MNRLRITTAALLAAAAIGYGSPPAPAAAAGPALTVDTAAGRHAISRDIYGMNFADEALARELQPAGGPLGRQRDHPLQLPTDTYNPASDWYFENMPTTTTTPRRCPTDPRRTSSSSRTARPAPTRS